MPVETNHHWASGIFEVSIDLGILESEEMPIKTWDMPITRYEMIKIMIKISENVMQKEETDVKDIGGRIGDYEKVSNEKDYRYYVEQAYAKGIVKGVNDSGIYAGDKSATRAEASTLIIKLIE